jgi:transcriptional regulator with XRE-family HTH domain
MDPSSTAPESIGERLRRLRLERGLSQRELSDPGISYAYISRIEAGARRPSVKALRMLARKLGVSADYLETGSEIRDVEERELRLADAELELRLADDSAHAVETLQALLEEAERAGDPSSVTRARIALGLAATRDGRAQEGIDHLERAIAEGGVTPLARPDVYTTLGRAYAATGTPARAVELFERCLADVTEAAPDDAATHGRFAVYLSQALVDRGDLDRAESVLRAAVDRSDELTDPRMRIRLYHSLGRVAAFEGRPTAALSYLRRAIALLELTDDTTDLARAHLGCAWTLNSAGRSEDAGPHLEIAEQLFGSHPERLDLAYLRTEQAKHAANTGDAEGAVAYAKEALDVLGDADPAERGSAWFALAQALALDEESTEAAEDAYRTSAGLLEEHGQRREATEALRAWAKFLRENGREADALDVLERATDPGTGPERVGAPTAR